MEQPKRIAFLSEHASPIALLGGEDAGGQNVYVDEVSRHLALSGCTVDIFTRRDNPLTPEIIEWASGVRVIHLTAGPAKILLKDQMWQYMPDFRDAFLRFVECNEIQYDLIHSNFWMSGWVALELKKRLGLPVVHIFHALGKTKRQYQGVHDTSPPERIEIEMDIVQHVDCVIAQCPNEQAELINDYFASPEHIELIPAAVNQHVFYPVPCIEARQVIGIDPQDFVVVYIGRMLPRKDVRNVVYGVAELLRICKDVAPDQLPRIKLLVVGGETMEPDPLHTPEIGVLQTIVVEQGIGAHVIFTGKKQQDRLRYYYSAGNVAVTTPWYEPFGLTPLESMACARPVIGSAVGGIAYTVRDGETGFLVEACNPHLLAARLYQMLVEPELGERMGIAAHERVTHEFTWPIVAQRLITLYTHIQTASTRVDRAPCAPDSIEVQNANTIGD